MFLVDANVLLYAVNEDAPHHAEARTWLDAALVGPEEVGFDALVTLAFLRITTRREIFPRPLSLDEACSVLAAWRSGAASLAVGPGPGHGERLCALLARTGTAGNLTNDAHLAALALAYGATVVTFDRDFARFPGVRVHLLGAG